VCIAVLCVVAVLGQVQAAPARNISHTPSKMMVKRLEEILRQRHGGHPDAPHEPQKPQVSASFLPLLLTNCPKYLLCTVSLSFQ